MRIIRRASVALLLLCWITVSAFAQPPSDLGLQGRLDDDNGEPLSGRVDMEIAIFDALSGGDPLYSEVHESVKLGEDGSFDLAIGTGGDREGSLDAETFRGANRYLEMVVDGDVMEPRQPLHSVPYALQATEARRAKVADRIEGFAPEDFDQSGHVERTHNPHRVTAAQVGAPSRGDIAGLIGVHSGGASAHHAKTTTFDELTDEIADGQIPDAIARKAGVMDVVLGSDGAGSGLEADTLDGVDSSEFARTDDTTWVRRSRDTMSGDLDVAGAVLASDGFHYSRPRTGYATASGASYTVLSPALSEVWMRSPVIGAHVSTSGFAPLVATFAPIQLPHGATIERILCRFRDTSPNANVDLSARLVRKDVLSPSGVGTVAAVSISDDIDSDEMQVVEAGAASLFTNLVDNDRFEYSLLLFWSVEGIQNPTDLTWHGCSVEYATRQVPN